MEFIGTELFTGLLLVAILCTLNSWMNSCKSYPSGGDSDVADPMYFGESRGHLHLVDTAQHENRLHLNVYEMLMDNSGWFVKYEVRLDELPGAFPKMIHNHHHPSSSFYYEFHVFDVKRKKTHSW
ncbi:hypothetical protein R6Q57_015389 [Mikania cordata]